MPNPNFPTSGDIVTQARKEAGIGTNPKASALGETELLLRLNDLNSEGVAYPTKQGFLGFWFNDTEQIISSIANTTLSTAISSGAATMTLASGTGWDSPSSDLGAGYVKTGKEIYDFFAFEARSSGVLSTMNGIQMAHAAAEEIHKLYKLNTDFGWPRNLFRQSRTLTYRQRTPGFRQIPLGGTYTIKYIESTSYNGLFVVFPEDVGAIDWTMLYQKAASNITTTTQSLNLPGRGHGRRYYIEGLKAYIYHNEGETEDEQKSEAKAAFHLDSLLEEFGIEDMSGDQSIQVPDA